MDIMKNNSISAPLLTAPISTIGLRRGGGWKVEGKCIEQTEIIQVLHGAYYTKISRKTTLKGKIDMKKIMKNTVVGVVYSAIWLSIAACAVLDDAVLMAAFNSVKNWF